MSVRVAIRDLQASRIGEIVALGFGDPDIIPLWYGESDLPTPGFVGEAASAALAFGLATLSYRYFETPFLKMKARYHRVGPSSTAST